MLSLPISYDERLGFLVMAEKGKKREHSPQITVIQINRLRHANETGAVPF